MSAYERYLTLWVGLCIVVGIALGHFFAPAFQTIGAAEIANVNLPVAGAECRRVSANGLDQAAAREAARRHERPPA